ncbi:MAG: dihydroorotase, multifunctional complex type [Chitinophagaceae bacterium]|nr:dihydroorotase, multifunctional complex type [Chitinophagaceae bacterium]
MKVLLKDVIISSSSPNTKPTDILIDNGVIVQIEKNINSSADTIIQHKNLHVSVGWMDCFANFCDPGNEHKETLETGSKAAAAGGYTEVMLIPNTNPPVHNKSQVEYIVQRSKNLPVTIHPIGAITKNAEGKDLGEMYDMRNSGAIAFSDGISSLQSSGIMLKALEYIKAIDGTIIQLPDDKNIATNGLMNEGIFSIQLGLPGKPAISEEILIARDIELVKYTGSKIHFTGISTKRSLEIISKAKKDGLQVSCSVTPYHLFFNDEDMKEYDTNLKVNPPLRTKDDMLALRKAIKSGIIDFIASHHQPQHWDDKTCEFEYAKYGMTGLESVFGVAGICGIDSNDFINMQTENIRKIFNINLPQIAPGAKANLTLFDPAAEYIFNEKNIYSRSRNTPYIGKKLKGKSFGIINGDRLFLNEIN